MTTAPSLAYAEFLLDPGRHDVHLYDVVVPDETGTSQTFRWSNEAFESSPSDSPASTTWEPRVREGGVDFESPAFDFNNPQFGALAPVALSPLVVVQFNGDLDQYVGYQWARATVTIRHGGWTTYGAVPLSAFRTIAVHELNGVPTFGVNTVTFYLRSLDARFNQPVERRTHYSLGWCIEGDGASAGVNFAPFAPGVRLRGALNGSASSNGGSNLVLSRPDDYAEGDLLVAWIASHSNGGSPYVDWSVTSAPAGWTVRIDVNVAPAGVAAHRLYLWTKVATASEPATYTFVGTGTACNRPWNVSVWYGQDGTTPTVDPQTNTGTLATSLVAPSVTTARNGDVAMWAYASRSGHESDVPSGTTNLANVRKSTPGGNAAVLRAVYEVRPSSGATGTRTLAGTSSTSYAAAGIVISNQAAGGQPEKLDLRDSIRAQGAVIPYSVSGSQQLFGWEVSPFRLWLNASGNFVWSYQKGASDFNHVFDEIALVAYRRYHFSLLATDTSLTLRVYDWWADAVSEQSISGSGFNNRDGPLSGTEAYTLLYNENGGSPNLHYSGQLWSLRVWSGATSMDALEAMQSRPLTELEKLDASLVHYLTFGEKSGTLVNDYALDPADGTLSGAEWRPTLTGSDEIAGEQVPSVFGGPCPRVPGVMIETAVDGSFFMVHPVSAEGIREIQEGGAPRQIDVDYEGDEYPEFLATLPEVGFYSTYRGDVGTFYRARTAPTLDSTCRVDGDAYDGTFVSLAGDVVNRVITTRGEEPITAVDAASLSALNAAAPQPVGSPVLPNETIADFCRRILGTVGAVLYPKRDGEFAFMRWEAPSGTAVETIDWNTTAVDSLNPVPVEQPVKRVIAKIKRNWNPLSRDQVSGQVQSTNEIRAVMREWLELAARRWSTAAANRHARDLEVEMYFCGPGAVAAGVAEAERQLDLFAQPGQAFELTARSLEQRLEFGDVVNLHAIDIEIGTGLERSRLGTSSTTPFRVCYVRSERGKGIENFRAWRPDITDGGA